MKKNQMAKLGFTLFSAGLISANVMADDAKINCMYSVNEQMACASVGR